jgi:hypothetical protein
MWGQTKSQRGSRAGRSHFESVQAETWRLRSYIGLQEYPMPESQWRSGGVSVGHVDGHPAVHHLQTNSIKSVEAPLNLYIRILTVELTHTALFL